MMKYNKKHKPNKRSIFNSIFETKTLTTYTKKPAEYIF